MLIFEVDLNALSKSDHGSYFIQLLKVIFYTNRCNTHINYFILSCSLTPKKKVTKFVGLLNW